MVRTLAHGPNHVYYCIFLLPPASCYISCPSDRESHIKEQGRGNNRALQTL
ncbi:hypothetical protein PN499_05735 [Kamptonema animale CS-326]|uniref:hypothetical protein n=1 Tax=Kamptonema animale TaxID=92934 RepID=UPI00232AFE5C|nr:hypothetical protein [Kamptonema animale]MDB9510677.1 hypothetical protein [Kamptonema animale CS-326]